MPVTKEGYKPCWEWLLLQEEHERVLALRHIASGEEWSCVSHEFVPLTVGMGGVVAECFPHSWYKVKLDGMGQITLRNRVVLGLVIPYGEAAPSRYGVKPTRKESPGVQVNLDGIL